MNVDIFGGTCLLSATAFLRCLSRYGRGL